MADYTRKVSFNTFQFVPEQMNNGNIKEKIVEALPKVTVYAAGIWDKDTDKRSEPGDENGLLWMHLYVYSKRDGEKREVFKLSPGDWLVETGETEYHPLTSKPFYKAYTDEEFQKLGFHPAA